MIKKSLRHLITKMLIKLNQIKKMRNRILRIKITRRIKLKIKVVNKQLLWILIKIQRLYQQTIPKISHLIKIKILMKTNKMKMFRLNNYNQQSKNKNQKIQMTTICKKIMKQMMIKKMM